MSLSTSQEPKYAVSTDGKLINRTTGKAIPDDEPVMIFRAKDTKAMFALNAYLDVCNDKAHRATIKRRIADFTDFAAANPELMREPDTATAAITMESVVSSNVESIGYDAASMTLAIKFKSGALYHYYNVPATTYTQMKTCESIGSYVSRNVRTAFDSEQIAEAREPATA